MAIETKDKLVTLEALKASHDTLSDEIDAKADLFISSATNCAVASFPDGANNAPLKDLTVGIEPVQDLHGYDNPWPAGGGKNLIPDALVNNSSSLTENGVTLTVSDGVFVFNGTSARAGGRTVLRSIDFTLPAGTYYFSKNVSNCYVQTSNVSMLQENEGSFTLSEETTVNIGFNVGSEGTVYTNFVFKPQIETGSSKTSWQPYSNICPITGWTGANVTRAGKNLFDKSNVFAGFIDDAMGAFVPTSSAYSTDFIHVVAGASYYIYSEQTSGAWGAWYDANKSYISGINAYRASDTNKVKTAPANAAYMRLTCIYMSAGSLDTFGIYYPATYDGYLAYTGTTLPISWQSSAGTVYGGTLDATTGVLTVDRACDTYDGSSDESWGKLSTGSASSFAMACSTSEIHKGWNNSAVKCNYLQKISNAATWGNFDNWVSSTEGSSSALNIVTGIKAITTVADWRTYLGENPLQICYELATPQTYQLDPVTVTTLLGQNNVWSDTGDILNCEYVVDTKEGEYVGGVGKSVGELKDTLNSKADQDDLASPNLTGTTNTTGSQIDAGTYFYLNGVLVKAKVDIASGATFTDGTNYDVVTIGEGLSILNLKWDGIIIASGTNLNTITTPGIYRVGSDSTAQTLLNCPTTRTFVMLVTKRGDSTNCQIIFLASSTESNIYIRTNASGGWLQWFGISLAPVST